MGRRNRRSESTEFELYSAPCVLGVRFIRRIGVKEGDTLVDAGKAKLIFSEECGRYVYQLVAEPDNGASKRTEDVSHESSSVLTKIETEAVVGFFGESKTAGLSDAQRRILRDLNQETHDFVERAQVKLRAFDPRYGRVVVLRAIAE